MIGGEYCDCQFDAVVPGTEEISGSFPDAVRERTEWQRLTFCDRSHATIRYVSTQEARV